MLKVWAGGVLSGRLDRAGTDARRCAFAYDPSARPSEAVSLTMPLTLAGYEYPDGLHPIFQMNLPEGRLREVLEREQAAYLEQGIHLIAVQSADGSLVVGDSHVYGDAEAPFASAQTEDLIMDEFHQVFNLPKARVTERWVGSYASADDVVYKAQPSLGVALGVVTGGTGASIEDTIHHIATSNSWAVLKNIEQVPTYEDLLLGLLERPDGLLGRALQDAEVDASELASNPGLGQARRGRCNRRWSGLPGLRW